MFQPPSRYPTIPFSFLAKPTSPAQSATTFDLTTLVSNNNPFRFQSVYLSALGDGNLIFDTGASISISPFHEDFIDYAPDSGTSTLQGVSASTVIAGKGTLRLYVTDDEGIS